MIGLVIALLGLGVAVWALCGVSGRSEEREDPAHDEALPWMCLCDRCAPKNERRAQEVSRRQRRALREVNKRWRGR